MFLAKQRGQVSLGSREANWELDGGGKARRCSGGEGYWQRKGGAGREDWGPHPGACPGHLSGFKWQGVGRTGTAVVGLGPCSLLSSQSLRMPDAVQPWRDLSAAPPTPYCTPRTLYSPGDAVLVGGDPLLLLSPPRSVPSARCIVMTVFAQPVPITSLLHSPAPATWPVPFWQLAHNREGHRLGRCLPGRTWDT